MKPADDPNGDSVLGLMLPFGSIDQQVRSGSGSYLIRYQKSTATILDVFYAETAGRFPYTLKADDEAAEKNFVEKYAGKDKASDRLDVNKDGKSVVGWYGGGAGVRRIPIEAPSITVYNEETLYIDIDNSNNYDNKHTCDLNLIVTGATSHAQKMYKLVAKEGSEYRIQSDPGIIFTANANDNVLRVVLDDITNSGNGVNRHFADQFVDIDANNINRGPRGTREAFIAGEDLIIEAIAFDKDQLSNIAHSEKKQTNSLFASLSTPDSSNNNKITARIANMRHLENLDSTVSRLGRKLTKENSLTNSADSASTELNISKAEQIDDISWTSFTSSFTSTLGKVRVLYYGGDWKPAVVYNHTEIGTYKPISLNDDYKSLTYDGKGHTISDVVIDDYDAGDSGLFATLEANSHVSNLVLQHFTVKASDSHAAGTLAGTVKGDATISNVLATFADDAGKAVSSVVAPTDGCTAGGLVGAMDDYATVEKSAAVVSVNGSSAAGGLVGAVMGGTIRYSYSGGQTIPENQDNGRVGYDKGNANVQSSGGSAGGLVGSVSDGNDISIRSCYSTCSVSSTGTTAGGFVGTFNAGTIDNCYAIGPVFPRSADTTAGAFAGTASGTFRPTNYYLDIVYQSAVIQGDAITDITDQFTDTDGKVTGPVAVGSGNGAGVAAADTDVTTYNRIAGATSKATTYNAKLPDVYPYKTIAELDPNAASATEDKKNLLVMHYGDWPDIETWIVNTKS